MLSFPGWGPADFHRKGPSVEIFAVCGQESFGGRFLGLELDVGAPFGVPVAESDQPDLSEAGVRPEHGLQVPLARLEPDVAHKQFVLFHFGGELQSRLFLLIRT